MGPLAIKRAMKHVLLCIILTTINGQGLFPVTFGRQPGRRQSRAVGLLAAERDYLNRFLQVWGWGGPASEATGTSLANYGPM